MGVGKLLERLASHYIDVKSYGYDNEHAFIVTGDKVHVMTIDDMVKELMEVDKEWMIQKSLEPQNNTHQYPQQLEGQDIEEEPDMGFRKPQISQNTPKGLKIITWIIWAMTGAATIITTLLRELQVL